MSQALRADGARIVARGLERGGHLWLVSGSALWRETLCPLKWGFCQSAVSLPQPCAAGPLPTGQAGLSLCGRLLEFVILPNPASDPCG